MRFNRTLSLTLALSLVTVGSAMAQRPDALGPGTKSISFSLPGNNWGQDFGFWNMISENLNLGINVGLGLTRSSAEGNSTSQSRLSIGPSLRYYTGSLGPVVPFLYGNADLGYSKSDTSSIRSSKGFGLAGGLGAEWFPVSSISIGGYTGIRLSTAWSSVDLGGTTRTMNSTTINTVTSGLSINLYFGGRTAAMAAGR